MCVGPLAPPKPPSPPPPVRQQPAPTVKSAQAPAELVEPEKIKEQTEGDELIDTKKKKALEIQKTKKGVKEFSAIDPTKTGVDTPAGGVNVPE
tara:strand:- start:500 stop:778 length:279 start_codon:yes stop_codon:yes gene_type:complete